MKATIKALAAADGTFRVRFGASPIYLRAAAPVALLGADAATMQE